MKIKISQESGGKKGSFFMEEGKERVAEMTYSFYEPDTLVIEHTEVKDELEGKGVGRELVAFAVAYAREHQYKIRPVCPFTKKVMEHQTEYHDVLVA